MGALDTGIVTPARTIVQTGLGVDDQLGVWMLTIYTLSYAVSIPIMGKFADKFGRKYVYLICVFLFGLGSFICGFSHNINNFWVLIAGRAIQAFGGGGIMPVATAEFGTAFPEEKRGLALGLVGGVYGVANVFGSSVGSLILDIAGQQNWQFIFYVNLPICAFIIIAGIFKLPNRKEEKVAPIDWAGIIVLSISILALLYGLKNIDFFDFINSIQSIDVYPFLLIFIVLLPIFIFVENKAKDPVMNLAYFKNGSIIITLICSLCAGVIMMAAVFLPQFCENALFIKSGAGGYFIIILGLFAGLGSPMSGKMIDKMGVKLVLGLGFALSAIGAFFLAFIACKNPNLITVVVSLILLGLGMGFTMGTPLNYMMLQKTDDSEANSSLATLSLVRSIGTAIAPAIMVAFIAHAGMGMQDRLMDEMPNQVTVTPFPYAQELDAELDDMRNTEKGAEMLSGLDIPRLTDYTTIEVQKGNTDGDMEISDETQDLLESSDVTTIVDSTKVLVAEIFDKKKPDLIKEVTDGINTGISSMNDGLIEMDNAMSDMKNQQSDMSNNINTMNSKITEMENQQQQMQTALDKQKKALEEMEKIPPPMRPPTDELKAAIAKLEAGIKGINTGKTQMQQAVSGMKQGYDGISSGINDMQTNKVELQATIDKLTIVRDTVPSKFNEAETNYLTLIDNDSNNIEHIFQSTLNEGFFGMFIFSGISSIIGFILLLFYQDKTKSTTQP